jgi:uncharacterized membrane protein YdjX (TVP38/TMEM64 family)
LSALREHWRWLLAGIGLIALSVAASFLPLADRVAALGDWVETLGPFGVVAFALVYAVATVLLIPGSLLTLSAGLVFGVGLGALSAWSGAVLGASLAFLAGRYLARSRVEAQARRNAEFQAIDQAIAKQGWKLIGLLRLSPLIPFNVSNYLYGITKVGFWPYAAATAIGILPGTLLYAYLGAAGRLGLGGGARQHSTLESVFFGVGLLASAGVAFWVNRIAKQALLESGAAKGHPKRGRAVAARRS